MVRRCEERGVPAQTQNAINERIRAETARSVRYFEKRADEIPARLSALDEEWDIERAIEANASALALFWGAYGHPSRQ
jgi:hypothetical protein